MLERNLKKLVDIWRIDILLGSVFMIIGFFIFNKTTSSPQFFIAFVPSILGSVLILASFPLIFPTGIRSILYLISVTLVSGLHFADTLFYRYFTDVLSVGILTQASVVGSVESSVMNLIHKEDLYLFLGPILLLALYLGRLVVRLFGKKNSRRTAYSEKKYAWKKGFVLFLCTLIIGIGASYVGLKLLLSNQPGILKSFYDRVYIAQNLGFVNYHAIDAYRYITTLKKNDVTDAEIKEAAGFVKAKAKEMKKGTYLEGAGKGKNLIVIQTEALQGFVIGAKLDGRLIAPNLTKLAAGSQYFDNYYCETAGGGTSDAEFLANTSLYPVKEGAVYIRFSGNDFVTMPGLLKENGYSTMAMHSFKAGFWNRSVMYKTMGFDKFYNKNDMVQDEI